MRGEASEAPAGASVAKIGDFGLAVALDRSRLTQAGMMVGTVAYMAPEQALGQTPEPRSDLYSLGCILYEMLTGRPPFVGDESVAIVTQHPNTPARRPHLAPPRLPTRPGDPDPAAAGERPGAAAGVRRGGASGPRERGSGGGWRSPAACCGTT